MTKSKVTKDVENHTLIMERVFDAPRDRVWEAFSKQELFEKWWGPEGWETTTKQFDFQPGGKNHYCMTCVDKSQGEWFGQESWGMMVYENIDEPNSFTFKDYFSDATGTIDESKPGTTSTYEFHEEDGKTRLVARAVTGSPEQLKELIDMGMVEGADSSMDKLEQLVQQISS